MRLFITGATGTLGKATVERLVTAGHSVVGLARSEENERTLRALGATPHRGDLFNRASLEDGMAGCEAALHLATKIPPAREAMKRNAWAENDRIRTEGTKTFVDAAIRASVPTVVYPSVCLLYADNGERWIDESGVVHAPPLLYSAVIAEKEIGRFAVDGDRGIILRMGGFSGPEAPNTEEALAMARKGMAPLVGPPDAYFSRITVSDAASAVVAALDNVSSGTYNVVEDDPKTREEIASEFAGQVGRKRLFRIPLLLVRLMAGRSGLVLARSQRVSNRRFKEAAGWSPQD